MVKDHSNSDQRESGGGGGGVRGILEKKRGEKGERKEGNVLFNDAFNTFLIYAYMASDLW